MTTFRETSPRWKRRFRTGLRVSGAVVLVLLLLVGLLAYWPMRLAPISDPARPDLSYTDAVALLRQQARDSGSDLQPECVDQLLEHGHPTERTYVLLHGLSNCPAQFRSFGELLYERGANVVIPRLPYHGEEDRLTKEWKVVLAGWKVVQLSDVPAVLPHRKEEFRCGGLPPVRSRPGVPDIRLPIPCPVTCKPGKDYAGKRLNLSELSLRELSLILTGNTV